MEPLTAGPSMMTDGSDPLELQHSCDSCCMHGASVRLRGIKEGPNATVTLRTGIVSVLEVPKALDLENNSQTPPIQKRILQVAAVQPHNCLAFDPLENEKEREQLSEQVHMLLHPKTRRLLEDITDAGKFPRKRVVRPRKIPPLNLPPDFAYASGTRSARTNLSMYSSEVDSVQDRKSVV